MRKDETQKPNFRRLTLNDSRSMSDLENRCFTLPWSNEQCAGALKQRSFRAYGLWRAKRLIAYISFYLCHEELEIVNFAVLPEERRQGYGNLIMRLLLQTARNAGILKVVLETRASNVPAINLYEKHGFSQCGLRLRYYPDTKEEALIYCKII